MKKFIVFFLTLTLSILAGCGSDPIPASETVNPTNTNNISSTPAETEEVKIGDDAATDVLTTENCEALAHLFSADDYSIFDSFSKNYKGKTIKFDGCITFLDNYKDYSTRYNVLLSAGNFVNEDTQNPGPEFRIENMGAGDLSSDSLSMTPEYVPGTNVEITARVGEFNSDTGIFTLTSAQIVSR